MSLVDLAELPRIAGAPPQLSPDGRPLAYLLTRTDWKAGRLVFQLWRQEVGGGAPVQLTFSDGGVQPGGAPLVARRQDDALPARRADRRCCRSTAANRAR